MTSRFHLDIVFDNFAESGRSIVFEVRSSLHLNKLNFLEFV